MYTYWVICMRDTIILYVKIVVQNKWKVYNFSQIIDIQ